jgi:lipid-A-disaccharide synthase
LLLCLLPFEKEWYAANAPDVRVEFVGHPILDSAFRASSFASSGVAVNPTPETRDPKRILLLPGSREGEIKRHLPVMLEAAGRIRASAPVEFLAVLSDERLEALARGLAGDQPGVRFQQGHLREVLRGATLAIASTGTVTLECALAGVPTVALYKTSPVTYAVGKRIIQVKWLSMPNLLAHEAVFPEFIQDAATAENIAAEALALLGDEPRRRRIQQKLKEVVAALGDPGATRRAAKAIMELISQEALQSAEAAVL